MKKLLLFTLLALTCQISFGKNKEWKCIKEDGSLAFAMDAEYVSDFQDGLAKVQKLWLENNQWHRKIGFVNTKGETAVKFEWDEIKGTGFVNGHCWVKKDDEKFWSLIDKKGNIIPTKGYEKVGYLYEFNPSVAAVYEGSKFGWIDIKSGKEIIPCIYSGASYFNKGLACVYTGDGEKGYGFLNMKGEMVIPMQFKQSGTASFDDNGLCRAQIKGVTVLIDTAGNVAFKTSKGNIQGMYEDWILIFQGKNRTEWGYINYNDEWVIDPVFDYLWEFNDLGLAVAEKDGLQGVIDTTGKVVIPIQYATVYCDPNKDGMIMCSYPTKEAMSLMDTPKDYYNAQLEKLEFPNYTWVGFAKGSSRIPFKNKDGMTGFLDRNFKEVIPAKYSRAAGFSEGHCWVLGG